MWCLALSVQTDGWTDTLTDGRTELCKQMEINVKGVTKRWPVQKCPILLQNMHLRGAFNQECESFNQYEGIK